MRKLVENPGNDLLKKFDSDEVVLSVPAGGTYQLIKRHLIHAHPNHRNYNYGKLKHLITFRQAGGGRMDAIYYIDSTFVIVPDRWKGELKGLRYSLGVENRIENYIIERIDDFGFKKHTPFKFYILSLAGLLPHNPRPKKNNAGHRYYQLGNLLDGKEYV